MNMVVENCDIYSEVLGDIIQVLLEIVHEEDKTYEHNIRIRNILDDLDNFNITMQLNEIDMIKYTMLLSMKNIEVERIDMGGPIKFYNINFTVEDDKEDYIKLIDWYKRLRELLIEKYNFDDDLLQYIEPNSRLVDIRVSMSIKDFVYFIISCAKYNELMDIMVMISNYDDIFDYLVSISTLLNNLIVVDDLFIRTMLDPDNRRELMQYEDTEVYIISNEDYINHCLEYNKAGVKLSTIGTCTMVAYRELVSLLPKQQIKIENLQDVILEDSVNTLLPKEFCEVDEYIVTNIHNFAQAWYNLSKRLNPTEYSNEIMLCSLGCFSNVFKMNTMIENYYKLQYESENSEVKDIMNIVQQKITNKLGGN